MWYIIALIICIYIVWWLWAINDGCEVLWLTIAVHIFVIAVVILGTLLKLIFGRG